MISFIGSKYSVSSLIKWIVISSTIILSTACSYYPTEDGQVHAQPIGDFQKCIDKQNHELPTCFCHTEAIAKNPERTNFCKITNVNSQLINIDSSMRTAAILDLENTRLDIVDAEDNWLSNTIGKNIEVRTEEWLKEFRSATLKLEQPINEDVEFWSDNTSLYLSGKAVFDDCDTSDSLLDLAFALGGFHMSELTKILVDTNPYDHIEADHYIAAVWVGNQWMVIDQQDESLKPLLHVELGGYITRDGKLAREAEIVAYRKLNQANWHEGRPPKITSNI